MKVKPDQVRTSASRLDPAIRLVLLYGPDESAAADLARQLGHGFGADAERVELSGDELKRDVARLADEAASPSLFGTPRYILARISGDEALASMENLLSLGSVANPVVALASSLTEKSKLTKLVQDARNAWACACWLPSAGELAPAIRDMAREAGLSLSRDLADRIAAYTGADRRLAMAEIEKLALYHDAQPGGSVPVTADDLALLGAAQDDDGFDAVVGAVLGGELKMIDAELARVEEMGISEVGLVLALQRRVGQLSGIATRWGGNGSLDSFLENESKAKRLFWKDMAPMARLLSRWRGDALTRLNARLIDLHMTLLYNSQSAGVLLRQELLTIARAANASRRG